MNADTPGLRDAEGERRENVLPRRLYPTTHFSAFVVIAIVTAIPCGGCAGARTPEASRDTQPAATTLSPRDTDVVEAALRHWLKNADPNTTLFISVGSHASGW